MPEIGERRSKDGLTAEWDGNAWRRVEAASAVATPPPAPTFDPTRVAAGPGAIPQGVDVSEAAPTVATIAAIPFAGAAGLGGLAARTAMSPVGAGVGRAIAGNIAGESVPEALAEGALVTAGAKVGGKLIEKALPAIAKPLGRAVEARLKHALVRGAKVAAEETAKAANVPAETVAKIGAAQAKRAAEKANAALMNEMKDYVVRSAQPGGLDSRAKIADALRIRMADRIENFSASAARKFTDELLNTLKIGPKASAAESGVSMNQQIRAARAAQAAKGS